MREQNRKLKIAVLISSFSYSGGAQNYVVEVARHLYDKGHEIDIYAMEADKELLKGMAFHRVSTKYNFSSVLRIVSFARDTSRMLSDRHYDVVHSHMRAYSQDIMTLHCFSYKGGVNKHSAVRKIDKVYLSPRSQLYLWLERRQMQTPWLVGVSDAIREDVKEQFSRNTGVSVIPPGVDTARFHPKWVSDNREEVREQEKIKEGEMVVLFVGSEFRRKGLDYIIPAISSKMRLLVVGRGERWNHYRRLVNKCNVADKVKFVGWTDNIRRYYAAADVVVLPSLSEAFGMSILEGMACGLPVVASSNAGVSELINDGVNGFTISDASKLLSIFERLKVSDERRRLGSKARETAEEYTWDKCAEKYEKLYYQVADAKIR